MTEETLEQRAARYLTLFRKGVFYKDIAAREGIPRTKVTRVIDVVFGSHPTRHDHSKEFRARARALYEQGLSVAAVAREMGVGKNVISGISFRDGWPERPSPILGPRRDHEWPKIELRADELRRLGMTWSAISERVGVPPTTLRLRAKRLEERQQKEAAE